MICEFKTLLRKMAQLPQKDQKWVLQQLTAKQKIQFETLGGKELLQLAQRYRKLPLIQTETVKSMPAFCEELKQKHPLYLAMILKQGQFNWESDFLSSQRNSQDAVYQKQTQEQINNIKPLTQSKVFQLWQQQCAFEDHLDMNHG